MIYGCGHHQVGVQATQGCVLLKHPSFCSKLHFKTIKERDKDSDLFEGKSTSNIVTVQFAIQGRVLWMCYCSRTCNHQFKLLSHNCIIKMNLFDVVIDMYVYVYAVGYIYNNATRQLCLTGCWSVTRIAPAPPVQT